MGGVQGEQPLPGMPRVAPSPTAGRGEGIPVRPWRRYLAVTVTEYEDGYLSVHRVHMGPGQLRTACELLDEIPTDSPLRMTLAEVVNYWSRELMLRDSTATW